MSLSAQFSCVGLIGFGAFGKLIAHNLAPHVPLRVHDPVAQHAAAEPSPSLRHTSLAKAAACPLVILAVPVSALAALCRQISPDLRPGTVVMDVGSVKLTPCETMQQLLPPDVELLGSHPLFGPQSTKSGIAGHKIALCPLRGNSHRHIAALLRHLFGLKVITTTPADHDRELAIVQGLTHMIAKVLDQMTPGKLGMTTASFDLLQQASRMVSGDSPGVLGAILRDNPFAAEVRDDFLRRAAQLGAIDNSTTMSPAKEKDPPMLAGL
ncbi:prephenate dehydrogenase [Phaeobacter porticola]|uniref:Prephenate dehydrogenase-like protein n=1 Tax=Phaeobacter porticola TaxID=1844006 RepID=A0A1L3I7I7_9RHOB|nr:prephenate dehydrogenase [Phaeobacter porticola]APG48060.1 prephenate dehydrogenase-like protein [Phaeobacter porticola]